MIPSRLHEIFSMGASFKEAIVGYPDVKNTDTITHADRETGREYYETWERDCFDIGLVAAQATCQRIQDLFLDSNSVYGDFRKLNEELFGRVRDELKSKRFYYIPADKDSYYELSQDQLEHISEAFPSIVFEFEEAAKCYATGRNTGCVFHSMRALEIGLTALGKTFNVQTDRRNWENIINEIEARIRTIGPSTGEDWREQEQFYSEAALQFRFFKNAWRNHSMHVRDKYDEERAKAIFDHVREFMTHLARKSHPIIGK